MIGLFFIWQIGLLGHLWHRFFLVEYQEVIQYDSILILIGYSLPYLLLWMSIFSGATLYLNQLNNNLLFEVMSSKGEESVMYGVLHQIGNSNLTIPFTLFLIFLSYVTAADSNISAMSTISEKRKDNTDEEASIGTKIIWGLVIGGLTYIMLSTKGLDGIRILSVLGGFPALFIIIAAGISLVKILLNKKMISVEEQE